jgi:predicted flavoprotein YhiN
LNRLIQNLFCYIVSIEGKTTFKDEFVTAGGVNLEEVNPETMESKILPGLFFAGEVMDIDGLTGGFNFQAAWTTGYLAGMNAIQTDIR